MLNYTLNLYLQNHSYPIYIGQNILGSADYFAKHIHPQQKICVVSNTTVAPLYLDTLLQGLNGITNTVYPVILEDGEEYKNWHSLNTIYAHLLTNVFDRHSLIIALGGGVIGDMSGFAAASYMRGIDFIQVPTTLLAQVDSSIGGKTGINHPLGKNMIGAFCQPKAVIMDMCALQTLNMREIIAGSAEIIKHACIADADFFSMLEQNMHEIMRLNMQLLIQAIYTSCKIKANIVQQDEKEHNIRAYLNFGHTFAHAIETIMGYGTWLHGEAVGCGMVMASYLSYKLQLIDLNCYERIKACIKSAGLPITGPHISVQAYIQAMQKDKKNQNGHIQFIVLNGLGQAKKISLEYDILRMVLLEHGAYDADDEV